MPEQAITLVQASTAEHFSWAAMLFSEYAVSIRSIAACSLQSQGFDAEVRSLPGAYSQPGGAILLAVDSSRPIGCVAVRPLAHLEPRGGVCELKRMYVQPSRRGMGVGRLLAGAAMAAGRDRGYVLMKLDTSTDMAPAVALYRSLGFRSCERYNTDPQADTLWFECVLSSSAAEG